MMAMKVLVVEDEKDYLDLMARHLERRGFEVRTARNGAEAIEVVCNGEAIDVLVTDLMMPEMDGLELSRRAKEHDPYLPIVVISGVGTLETAISAMRQGGAFDYLPKPLESIRDLSLAVERASEYRKLHLDRQRLQAQILAERERLRTVMANAGDVILAAGEDDVITVANPAAEERLERTDLVGQHAQAALPAPLAALLVNWKAFDGRQPIEAEVPWPDEAVQMASLTTMAQEGGAGEGWVLILRDISRHKRMVELKMQLLASAADRLRSPLAHSVAALVDLNELEEDKSERFTGTVEKIMDELSRIRAWSDDLFDLVQVEAGRPVERVPLDLSELVQDSQAYLREGLITEKRLNLELKLLDVPAICVDQALLRRLLEQLVRQAAWKAPRESDLLIAVACRLGQIWLEVIGRDGAPQASGWQRFEAAYEDPRRQNGATGLELALAKSIADKVGGQIWLSNDPATSNSYAVSFPAAG